VANAVEICTSLRLLQRIIHFIKIFGIQILKDEVKKVDTDLNKMFSNIRIRILSSLINSPTSLEDVTLYID